MDTEQSSPPDDHSALHAEETPIQSPIPHRPPKLTGSPQPIPGRCGAQLRGTAGQDGPGTAKFCKKFPMKGKRRCERCGGKTPPGWMSARRNLAATDRASGLHLPAHIVDRFQASLHDEKLLDLTPDIALLDVLTNDAVANVQSGASAERWQKACDAFVVLSKAQTKLQFRTAMATLGATLSAGSRESEAREETARMIERRVKAVKTHRQLQMESEDLIPSRRVGLAMAMVANLVREFITDDQQRTRFAAKFAGLIGPRLRGEVVDVSEGEPAPAAEAPAS